MNRRTEEQIRAYVDGYNDCFQQFYDYLKNRKNVMDSIKKMRVYVDAVNNVVKERREE